MKSPLFVLKSHKHGFEFHGTGGWLSIRHMGLIVKVWQPGWQRIFGCFPGKVLSHLSNGDKFRFQARADWHVQNFHFFVFPHQLVGGNGNLEPYHPKRRPIWALWSHKRLGWEGSKDLGSRWQWRGRAQWPMGVWCENIYLDRSVKRRSNEP